MLFRLKGEIYIHVLTCQCIDFFAIAQEKVLSSFEMTSFL